MDASATFRAHQLARGHRGRALHRSLIGSLWYGPLFAEILDGAHRASRKDHPARTAWALTFGTTCAARTSSSRTSFAHVHRRRRLGVRPLRRLHGGLHVRRDGIRHHILFESRPFKLWPINAGYQTLVFTVMGVILGALALGRCRPPASVQACREADRIPTSGVQCLRQTARVDPAADKTAL